jgi:hypothetical protein
MYPEKKEVAEKRIEAIRAANAATFIFCEAIKKLK